MAVVTERTGQIQQQKRLREVTSGTAIIFRLGPFFWPIFCPPYLLSSPDRFCRSTSSTYFIVNYLCKSRSTEALCWWKMMQFRNWVFSLLPFFAASEWLFAVCWPFLDLCWWQSRKVISSQFWESYAHRSVLAWVNLRSWPTRPNTKSEFSSVYNGMLVLRNTMLLFGDVEFGYEENMVQQRSIKCVTPFSGT